MESTAAVIIIGDEILKGQTVDTNSHFLSRQLYKLGVRLCCISVIQDDVDQITEEVRRLASKYTWIFTTGGIGPTHDDITYRGVAKAFGERLVLNTEIVEVLKKVYPTAHNQMDPEVNPVLRMAQIPESGVLNYLKSEGEGALDGFIDNFPVVSVFNVYIFPGIPAYFQFAFKKLKHIFANRGTRFYSVQLYLQLSEVEVAPVLNEAVRLFNGKVLFGSYPCTESGFYFTKITMESKVYVEVLEAKAFLQRNFAPESIIRFLPSSVSNAVNNVYQMVESSLVDRLSLVVKKAVKVLETCFQKYTLPQLFLNFNGGKDCTVLLHLVHAVMQKHFPNKNSDVKLLTLYIRPDDPFPEVEAFIEESVQRYNLELKIIPGSIKTALEKLLAEKPALRAGLMGTRRTDPYSEKLNTFQMTDNDWPQVMRVSPLLDWDYQDVWLFLQEMSVSYCSLYDVGYTSLGGRSNTAPNPALLFQTNDGKEAYKPAYLLGDGASERSGRC
ncbi:FAD synthase-like [Schistocerca serialis cubense]|uniref:FAD synthase-like n=1 Tax=Schistocerca cancellata TaxID=274614 RepID=UPI00211982EC|nr:FAD synthase-like [Schistocerca cancellata]XP_049956207.1 FAD synthase-like [Schistocerca serialis cubense]